MFRRQIRVWRNRLRGLAGKEDLDAALGQELEFHFELLVQENIDDGMSPREAREAAQRVFGNVALVEEQCRDQRRRYVVPRSSPEPASWPENPAQESRIHGRGHAVACLRHWRQRGDSGRDGLRF